MQESDVMTATRHALMSRGYRPFHPTDGILCPKCHSRIVPPSKGRPDLLILHPSGGSAVCEVKDVNHAKRENALYFSEIKPEQREWLDSWDSSASSGLGAFLSIGLILPAVSRTILASVWVIPWQEWLVIEGNWKAYKTAGVGIMPEMYRRPPKVPRELYLDTYPGLERFKIFRKEEADGRPGWQFKDEHPLAFGHKVQPRFKKKEKENAA